MIGKVNDSSVYKVLSHINLNPTVISTQEELLRKSVSWTLPDSLG